MVHEPEYPVGDCIFEFSGQDNDTLNKLYKVFDRSYTLNEALLKLGAGIVLNETYKLKPWIDYDTVNGFFEILVSFKEAPNFKQVVDWFENKYGVTVITEYAPVYLDISFNGSSITEKVYFENREEAIEEMIESLRDAGYENDICYLSPVSYYADDKENGMNLFFMDIHTIVKDKEVLIEYKEFELK